LSGLQLCSVISQELRISLFGDLDLIEAVLDIITVLSFITAIRKVFGLLFFRWACSFVIKLSPNASCSAPWIV
jgi:hypothetical protein